MNIWEFFCNFAPNMTKNSTYLAPKPRYEILDGLRGVAAMLVVAYHLFETYYHGAPDQPINHGYLAVDFFFVLSGFVIGRITGSVLLITFEVSVLHIVLDPLCTSIGSIVFKCEGKDTNLFSNIQIFNVKNDQ